MPDTNQEKLGAASWSIYINLFLIALKLGAAIMTGSLGVFAELVHSTLDLMASLLAYAGIRKANKPADPKHHYGYERFENISSLAQAALIVITSALIVYEAYHRFFAGSSEVREGAIGVGVMVVALVIDLKISSYLSKTSEKTGSPALKADAYHFATDVMSTVAVIVGIGATALGYPVADTLAAVAVALLMLRGSFRLGEEALLVMLDRAPDAETLERISQAISSHPQVKGHHSLRARMTGQKVLADVSVHLSPGMTLEEAHRISEEVEMRVIDSVPAVSEIVIHMEPEGPHDLWRSMRRVFQ